MTSETKKLYRSREDRVIAGVCGGLGKHLNIDPRLLRLIFVLTAEVTAPVYILLCIFLDEEPVQETAYKST
jgi:phage shock protein PspC (stress-responsive transcriptional regulator)